jgi:hypothetical protein
MLDSEPDKMYWVCQGERSVYVAHTKISEGALVGPNMQPDPDFKQIVTRPVSGWCHGESFFVHTNKNRVLFFDFP